MNVRKRRKVLISLPEIWVRDLSVCDLSIAEAPRSEAVSTTSSKPRPHPSRPQGEVFRPQLWPGELCQFQAECLPALVLLNFCVGEFKELRYHAPGEDAGNCDPKPSITVRDDGRNTSGDTRDDTRDDGRNTRGDTSGTKTSATETTQQRSQEQKQHKRHQRQQRHDGNININTTTETSAVN
ncbi:hypothetical protein ACOMHN_060698 [Nucella lapillus]